MKPPLDEATILRPKDAAAGEDEWDEIPLSSVEVRATGTTEPASLLLADESAPVDVVGKLDRLPSNLQRRLLSKRQSFPVQLKISNVQHFAYGQDDNMEVVLWADGQAGWFKIRSSSRAYKSWYDDMVEAVQVLFFTADLVRTKKGRKLSATSIFEKFAEQAEFQCPDADSAAAIYKKHRRFLLHKMNVDGEGVRWRGTAIFDYLQTESEDDETDMSDVTPLQSSEDEAARLASRGKSSLRPRSGKHTKKSAKRHSLFSEDVDEEMADVASPDTPSVLKRKNREEDKFDARKRANTSTDSSLTPKPEDTLPLSIAAARPRPSHQAPPTITQPIPSYEPQDRLGDVWTCTIDGCNHKVYKASTKSSKALIKEHYRWHAVESQRQLDLIYKEERPYLPVGNLIKKIQEMAAQEETSKQPAGEANTEFPKPIRRRY